MEKSPLWLILQSETVYFPFLVSSDDGDVLFFFFTPQPTRASKTAIQEGKPIGILQWGI